MVATEKRISTPQLFTVIFILGMGLKMLMLPVLMLKVSGRDSVIGMAGIMLTELVCLGAMLAAIIVCPEKSFTELVRECVGKWAAKAVFALIGIFFVFKLLLISGEVRIFFGENVLKEYSSSVYAVPFYAMFVIMGMGSLRTMGRTSQFMFPFIAVSMIILFVFIGSGVDYSEVFPLGEYGTKNIAADALGYGMWYGDYSVLVAVIGSVKRSKFTAVSGIVAGVIAAISAVFYIAGLTAAYSNVCYLVRYGQNITGMSHYAVGNVMQGKIDLILFCVWMTAVFVKAGFFAFAATHCLCAAFSLNKSAVSLGIGITVFAVLLGWQSVSSMQLFMVKYLWLPAVIMQYAIPAFSLGVAIAGRHKDKRNNNLPARQENPQTDGNSEEQLPQNTAVSGAANET